MPAKLRFYFKIITRSSQRTAKLHKDNFMPSAV